MCLMPRYSFLGQRSFLFTATHQLEPWDNAGLVEEMFAGQFSQSVPNLEGILTHSTAIHI